MKKKKKIAVNRDELGQHVGLNKRERFIYGWIKIATGMFLVLTCGHIDNKGWDTNYIFYCANRQYKRYLKRKEANENEKKENQVGQ